MSEQMFGPLSYGIDYPYNSIVGTFSAESFFIGDQEYLVVFKQAVQWRVTRDRSSVVILPNREYYFRVFTEELRGWGDSIISIKMCNLFLIEPVDEDVVNYWLKSYPGVYFF